ncbi:hypothetical protein BJF81_05175 [Ornithinimicrobium sp. CNJ-824]|uniref:2'-5' RNA ligase family protein n=1 Tax=Ornithinimicrobium sp. CNJ-824 TaxID=1904966 RepID=UPI000968EF80|nr:2'-5' RNA ligase family protein [Ornithinimicrobium sp. CNJ-824]OLT20650.1 hypothetical protein BJF81_05175 [Ornithinimicrobium sp. CNJ-824]
MSPAYALGLLLHPDDEAAARQEWAALEQAGVPSSLARHRGSTHRPHLTVVTGRAPDEGVLDLAARLLLPLLPLTAVVEGQVLLGGRSPALAHRLRVPAALREARDLLADRWPGADRRPWVPHLSLTRRTRHDHLVAALGALTPGTHEGSVRLVAARWWDPDTGTWRPWRARDATVEPCGAHQPCGTTTARAESSPSCSLRYASRASSSE